MISLNQVGVHFGAFELFGDISFLINRNDRIGLVGKNGAGKTTLLKIISGQMKPDLGTIAFASEVTIGYLPQHMVLCDNDNVIDETSKAFSEIKRIESELESINLQLIERTDYHSDEYLTLIKRLTDKTERYNLIGGHAVLGSLEQTLMGLGFERSDFTRQTSEFSGGWRMRIELAKLLLQRPDVLLLDEPTNHLDIESIQWLEDFLREYPGAVVLVSHDRAFLNNVSNRTIELMLGRMYDYRVPYNQFIELRKERREQQMAAYLNQRKMIEDTEEFIERFRYKATKAVQVQSRIKQLDKVERLEVDEEDLSTMHFRFPPAERSGTIVVEAKEVTKRYGELLVLDKVDLIVERGEKVCFVGRNGEGKTTLAKIIMKQVHFEGVLKIGHKVKIGYYAQNQADLLDENKTVFQTIDDIAVGDIRLKIRNILGSFLFSGETVDKKVKVLSGGERARLCLAKMLLEPANLLVLDEPTNHLDMRSKDILKQALLQFDGTVIVVSHDRDFLDGLTQKIYEFKHHKIKENIGGIYDFLNKKRISSLTDLERKIKEINPVVESNPAQERKIQYEAKKEYERELRKITNMVTTCENRITNYEIKLAEMDRLMADPGQISKTSSKDFFDSYSHLKRQLQAELANWEKVHEELEQKKREK